MKLKPKERELKPKHMRLTVPGQTYQNLMDYVEYYTKTYKDTIEPTDLMIEMASQFMAADTGFRRWRTGQDETDQKPARPNGGAERPTFPSMGQTDHERT